MPPPYARWRPMQPARRRPPKEADAIGHTLRHFLNTNEAWDVVPPASVNPRVEEQRLRGKFGPWQTGADLIPEWWYSPRRAEVLAAHDFGYRPRYEFLARQAATAWRWDGDDWVGRATYAGHQFHLVVTEEGSEGRFITAHEANLTREPTGSLTSKIPGLDKIILGKT